MQISADLIVLLYSYSLLMALLRLYLGAFKAQLRCC
jgi:hypothetical protein